MDKCAIKLENVHMLLGLKVDGIPVTVERKIMMTWCHYVIFWTYFDILIEFTSNMKYPGILKARNHEELKAINRGTISWCRDTIFLAERHVF